MVIKLIKTQSNPCTKCSHNDFKIINGAMVCMNCFNYTPKELGRDIGKKGN